MVRFVIRQQKTGKYHFELVHGEDEVILKSDGYTTKAHCENGVESVKRYCEDESRYDKRGKNGLYMFALKSKNGHVIGQSTLFPNPELRDQSMAEIQRNGPMALTYDLT